MKFRAASLLCTGFAFALSAYDYAVAADGCTPADPVVTPPAGSYSTNFPANENPLSEGGRWVTGKTTGVKWNDPASASGKAYATVPSGQSGSRYDDTIAHLSPSFQTYAANQFAEGTVYAVSGYSANHEVELLLRFSITPYNAHGYEVLWGLTGYLAVVRWNGSRGSYTALYDPGRGSVPVPRDGDVLRAEIRGNIVTVKINGNTVANVDVTRKGGTVWSSGQPGIGFWPVDGATPRNLGWKSFRSGNL